MLNGTRGAGTPAFALHCRGDVRLYCSEADCTPVSKKGRALLAILAAEQRPLGRTRIIDLLWSDRQEEQARASLRTLLADLKAQFGDQFDELLVVDRERVALGRSVRTDLSDPSLSRPVGELFEGLDHIDPELDEWLRLEREKWEKQGVAPLGTAMVDRARVRRAPPRWAWAAVLLLALAAGALLYFRPWAKPEQPVVAVLKFKDLTGKNALLADALAEELRLGLAQNPGIDVVGRVSSEDPAVVAAGLSGAAIRLDASHLVEGSLVSRGRELQMNIRLISARTGRTLWDSAANAAGADLAYRATLLAGDIAENLTDVLSRRAPMNTLRADSATYAALLAARAAIARSPEKAAQQRGVLQHLVREHPQFVPALVALSRATMLASDHPFYRGTLPLAQARAEAAGYARRAIALAPDYAPAYDVLAGAYRDMDEALPLSRKALSLSPGLASAHRKLAWELERVADYTGALDHWRAAARLDPLHDVAHIQLLRALDLTGHDEEVRRVGAAFSERVSDPVERWQFEANRAGYENDYSRGILSLIEAERIDPDDLYTQRAFFMLRWLFGPESLRPYAGEPDSFTAMVLDRDTDAIAEKMAASGADFFRLNFETFNVGEYLAEEGRLDLLVQAYDRGRASKHPPTMSEYYLVGDVLVLGLRDAGRPDEAEQMLRLMELELRRTKGLRFAYRELDQARIDMLSGRRESATKRLIGVCGRRWGDCLYDGQAFDSYFVFRPIRSDPRIARLRQRREQEMRREANEAVQEMLARDLRPARCRAIPIVCPSQS